MLYDEKGRLVSKDIFKLNAAGYYRRAGVVDKKYLDHLNIEYDTAIAQGTKARQWQEWMDNKDVFPNLKYVTVGDDHVRHKHQLLDGVIVKKGSAYCDKIIPVKDWGCRCDMIETTEAVTENAPNFEYMGPFEGNVGKNGIAISNKHPYYKEAKKDLNRIQERVDEFGLQQHIKNNRNIYNQYKGDADYKMDAFDEDNGGFLVIHKKADGLNMNERSAVDFLVKKGERVMLPEKLTAEFSKSFDLSINGSSFDIKTITGDVKKATEKRVKDAMEQASNALLFFQKKIDVAELKRGLGNLKKESRLNAVMIVVNDVMTVITKKEILAGDYSALAVLK